MFFLSSLLRCHGYKIQLHCAWCFWVVADTEWWMMTNIMPWLLWSAFWIGGLYTAIHNTRLCCCVDVLISYFCMSVSWLCTQLNTNTPESVLQFVEYVKELLLFLHENYILPALHYILQGLQHAWQAFQDSCKWVATATTPTSLSYPVPYQLPGRHWIGGIRQFERSAVRSACDHFWLALLDLSDSLILFWAPYKLSHCDC